MWCTLSRLSQIEMMLAFNKSHFVHQCFLMLFYCHSIFVLLTDNTCDLKWKVMVCFIECDWIAFKFRDFLRLEVDLKSGDEVSASTSIQERRLKRKSIDYHASFDENLVHLLSTGCLEFAFLWIKLNYNPFLVQKWLLL